jgi:hypothetical protein
MSTQISKLATKAECDLTLASFSTISEDLDYKKQVLQNRIDNSVDLTLLAAMLQEKTNYLASLENFLSTLSEGATKNKILDQINEAENEIISLKIKQSTNGAMRQLNTNFDLRSNERWIVINNDLIAQVQAKKAELPT